jgi:hypothetical protein
MFCLSTTVITSVPVKEKSPKHRWSRRLCTKTRDVTTCVCVCVCVCVCLFVCMHGWIISYIPWWYQEWLKTCIQVFWLSLSKHSEYTWQMIDVFGWETLYWLGSPFSFDFIGVHVMYAVGHFSFSFLILTVSLRWELYWAQDLLSSFFLGIDWFDSWAFGLDYQALW